MKTQLQKQHSALLRQYHTLCTIAGLSTEEKEAIKESYGVKSSRELTIPQLLQLIDMLQMQTCRWRRRVMAAIGAYLRRLGRDQNAEIIKGIACRAAGYKEFNHIPVARLRAIYNEFVHINRTGRNVRCEVSFIENELANLN